MLTRRREKADSGGSFRADPLAGQPLNLHPKVRPALVVGRRGKSVSNLGSGQVLDRRASRSQVRGNGPREGYPPP
jgi:hypothetical protein